MFYHRSVTTLWFFENPYGISVVSDAQEYRNTGTLPPSYLLE